MCRICGGNHKAFECTKNFNNDNIKRYRKDSSYGYNNYQKYRTNEINKYNPYYKNNNNNDNNNYFNNQKFKKNIKNFKNEENFREDDYNSGLNKIDSMFIKEELVENEEESFLEMIKPEQDVIKFEKAPPPILVKLEIINKENNIIVDGFLDTGSDNSFISLEIMKKLLKIKQFQNKLFYILVIILWKKITRKLLVIIIIKRYQKFFENKNKNY
jgi:hypothetical protein